jgi:hypothetical protein
MSDYVNQSYSGVNNYIIDEYSGNSINETVSWISAYTLNRYDGIQIGTNLYKVETKARLIYKNNSSSTLGVNENIYTVTITEPQEYRFIVRDVLGSGTLLLYSDSSNFLYNHYQKDIIDCNGISVYLKPGVYYLHATINCDEIPTGDFILKISNGSTIILEKEYDTSDCILNERFEIDAEGEYAITIDDSAGTCSVRGSELYISKSSSVSNNSLMESQPPYYPYGVAAVADNWENFSFYILDDIFGEDQVTPEGGLIKLYERYEPTSSWDLNKIRSNLDMFQSVGYMGIQLPVTSFVVPNPLKEDLRSNVFVEEYGKTKINKIVDMEKIPFRLADKYGRLINHFSINPNDYDFDLALNSYNVVPSYVKRSFLRMSFYDSPSTQTQELIGTMCLFFGGASIPGNNGTDGLIYEKLSVTSKYYSVYSPSLKKNTSSEGLTLYAFKYNYAITKSMPAYMKLEYYNAKTGKVTPLCPYRKTPIKVSELAKAIYFPFTLKYDSKNGYLFIPSEKWNATSEDYCWTTNSANNILSGVLLCKKPELIDESGLEPIIDNQTDYVDLGLPSGILWAKSNVGATIPTDLGLYFSWGNVDGHVGGTYVFSSANYDTTPGKTLTTNIPENSTYDAARKNMNDNWRLPTSDEAEELINNCEAENKVISGVSGLSLTSKINGKSIFFPCGGYYKDSTAVTSGGTLGTYWTSRYLDGSAECLDFKNDGTIKRSRTSRYMGRSVRGVKLKRT